MVIMLQSIDPSNNQIVHGNAQSFLPSYSKLRLPVLLICRSLTACHPLLTAR